ncbi:alpha-(1,3)-fucosyltransferase 7 [Elgaria multicarinata webbii]|uniref:alpha-(1,3)-fucosyltransferase 7 n=1 Tax=Elgaria multicarinata webbii TaxID=159646 RepID=UPI002FCCD9B2
MVLYPDLTRPPGVSLLGAVLCTMAFISFSSPSRAQALRNPPLMVLIWDWPFGRVLNLSSDICAVHYGIEGCWLTHNRSLYGQADVVAFHHRELQRSRPHLPKPRPHPGQKWLWISLESPKHTQALAGWNGTEWNWVMSYRQDADIFVPYGKLVPRTSDTVEIPEKTGLVSWVTSNYHHTQERARMHRSLSKHIKIDVFGKASRKRLCPDCLLPTISKYKFYLAFENSIHLDYISEKLWRNALLAGAVPVVLGPPRANYQRFLPAEAFIHVDDFSSAKELAHFLTAMNETSYRRYYEWKRSYAVKLYDNWQERFCLICQHYPSLPKEKVYPSLERWFWN